MARTSYDDAIEADFRFRKLVRLTKSEFAARGMLVHFWRIAQDHWGDEKSLVPIQLFKDEKLDPILACGLAEQRGELVYAKGSEKYFDWYLQRCRASKAAKLKRTSTPGAEPRITGPRVPEVPLTLTLPLTLTKRRKKNSSERNLDAVHESLTAVEDVIRGRVPLNLQTSWLRIYPKEFLEAELLKINIWLCANAHKAPKSNWGAFFTRWFMKGWEDYRKRMPSKSGDELHPAFRDLK